MPLTWDNAAATLKGRLVIVEVRQFDAIGNELTHEQAFGTVTSVDSKDGIIVKLGGFQDGKTLIMPADLSNFAVCPPGLYKLVTTGEELESPDYFVRWDITHKQMVGLPSRVIP